jgi:ATP-dependent RNA/DNA helicase IGHMBP2
MDKLTELKRLQELLAIEKQADLDFFKTVIQNKPLDQRRSEGFTWYPLSIKSSGYTYGERAFVVVERGGDPDAPHQFRSGNVVSLFTQQTDVYRAEYSGTIQYISKNTMRIVLNSKDLPDWLSGGAIGVDLLFDERTYVEMEKALAKVMDAKGNRLAELRDIFLGHKKQDIGRIPENTFLNLEKSGTEYHVQPRCIHHPWTTRNG